MFKFFYVGITDFYAFYATISLMDSVLVVLGSLISSSFFFSSVLSLFLNYCIDSRVRTLFGRK